MLYLFRKFFDSIEFRKEEAELRRKREVPPEYDPDEVEVVVPESAKKLPAPELLCRICGFEGTEEFCPTCLAATMVPRRAR